MHFTGWGPTPWGPVLKGHSIRMLRSAGLDPVTLMVLTIMPCLYSSPPFHFPGTQRGGTHREDDRSVWSNAHTLVLVTKVWGTSQEGLRSTRQDTVHLLGRRNTFLLPSGNKYPIWPYPFKTSEEECRLLNETSFVWNLGNNLRVSRSLRKFKKENGTISLLTSFSS